MGGLHMNWKRVRTFSQVRRTEFHPKLPWTCFQKWAATSKVISGTLVHGPWTWSPADSHAHRSWSILGLDIWASAVKGRWSLGGAILRLCRAFGFPHQLPVMNGRQAESHNGGNPSDFPLTAEWRLKVRGPG